MSLFIASLALAQDGVANGGLERLGIVTGSLLAGLSGYVAFRFFLDNRPKTAPQPCSKRKSEAERFFLDQHLVGE